MIHLRPNPKAVSSYSDQAFKARLREKLAAFIAKLFYYRPIEGEERQLDKKKLLYIGISTLGIAFVTSYIPYVSDWFTKTLQPTLFQQQVIIQPLETRPVLAPELSLQEVPKAVEVVSPTEEPLVDEALKPEPEGDLITSLENEEEEPLNILDYLFKPEDIKVETVAVQAPVPAPVAIPEDVKIDPFPIEAMPPEIRAQLGNSPPLEDLVGQPTPYRSEQSQMPELDSSYQGKTGVFRDSSSNTNTLSVYTDTSRVGSSLQLERSTNQTQSFSEPLNNQAASFHAIAPLSSSSIFREPDIARNTRQVFQSEQSEGTLSIFQSTDSEPLQSTVFQSVPSQSASYQVPLSESRNLVQYQAPLSEATNPVQYQAASEAVSTESYHAETPSNSTPSFQAEQSFQETVVFNNPAQVANSSTLLRDNDINHVASFQAAIPSALTLSIANESVNNIRVYSDTVSAANTLQLETSKQSEASGSYFRQQPTEPSTTTVFTQPTLIGGSTFRRTLSEAPPTEIAVSTEEADAAEDIIETVITTQAKDITENSTSKLALTDYLTASDQVEAKLLTGAILLANSTQPVLAKANPNWCGEEGCPDLIFIGTANYKSGNRTELSFNQVVFDGTAQQTSSIAIDDDNSVGLPVNLSDTTPTLAQDLARGALSGVASYANALANQTKITTSTAGIIEQSSVPTIENFVLGNLAKLFSTQAEQTAVVRIAELKANTDLTIIYDISERNSYERYTTPYRFSN